MPESRFAWNEAVLALREAGLLAGVLAGRDGKLQAAVAADLPGGFLGAALDSRARRDGELFVALAGERVDGRDFAPAVLERGGGVLADVDPAEWNGRAAADGAVALASPDPVAALGELARVWKRERAPRTVGITGTNGKTTTKDLTAALLGGAGTVLATSGNLNNHLGVPLTLLALREAHDFAVIEMGASAVGEIRRLAALAGPDVGVITNASPAHLAEFRSLEGIIEGKGEMVAALPADGAAILNADSPGFEAWRERATAPVISFGHEAGDHRWRWRADGADERGPALELDGEIWPVPLPGEHNAANLAAAILACRALGVPDRELRAGLAAFRGSDHRGVLLEVAGRRILDDCYNANPVSMLAAAGALVSLAGPGRAIAALGHMAELGDDSAALHHETGSRLAEAGLDLLVSVGEQARPLAEGFAARGGQTVSCADTDEAADWLARHTQAGDRILLKGSRSAGLERLLERAQRILDEEPGD